MSCEVVNCNYSVTRVGVETARAVSANALCELVETTPATIKHPHGWSPLLFSRFRVIFLGPPSPQPSRGHDDPRPVGGPQLTPAYVLSLRGSFPTPVPPSHLCKSHPALASSVVAISPSPKQLSAGPIPLGPLGWFSPP